MLAGSNAVFHVWGIDDTCALTYVWHYFDLSIPGNNDPWLTLTNVQPPPAANKIGPYSVVVTSVGGSVTSYPAYLSIVSGPMPSALKVQAGADVAFSNFVYWVGGPGPATQQWQFKGQDIPGATNTTLTLTNVQPEQTGPYSVFVRNRGGSVITSNAWLTVQGPARLWGLDWGPSGAHFHVSGSPNTTYRVDASRDFLNWLEIVTTNAPNCGTFEVFDPAAATFDWRCYRAVQPFQP